MKLSEKGRFAPPPKLALAAAQRVSEAVAAWDGVHARTHWFLGNEKKVDGVDFYFGEEEVGHIHLDAECHVMLPKPLADALLNAGLASHFPWGPSAVLFQIKSDRDVERALWLFQLSVDRQRGISTRELLKRIASQSSDSARTA